MPRACDPRMHTIECRLICNGAYMRATIMPPSEEKTSTSSALELLQMDEAMKRFLAILRQVKPVQRLQLRQLTFFSDSSSSRT